jgi:hypothetical protein
MTEAHSHLGTVVAEAAPDYVPASRKSTTHDVSGEKRDEHGRWTGDGASATGEARSGGNTPGGTRAKRATMKQKINDALSISGTYADDPSYLSHSKGEYTVRDGFYYAHGRDSKQHADSVSQELTRAGIAHDVVEHGTEHKPFRGGANVRNSSHWWVKVRPHATAKSLQDWDDEDDDLDDDGDASVKGLQAQLMLAVSATELELQRSRSGLEDS